MMEMSEEKRRDPTVSLNVTHNLHSYYKIFSRVWVVCSFSDYSS